MNENEYKSGVGARGSSLFSFLKPSAEDLLPITPTAPQAARPTGPSPEVAGLKVRVSELEENLRKLGNSASSCAVPADAAGRLPELERRLATLENMAALRQPDARPPEDDSKYVQMFRKAEAALLSLLESDRRKAGETAVAMQERLEQLESGFSIAGGAINELKSKLEEAFSALENFNNSGQTAGQLEAERNAASAALLERGLRELKAAMELRLCAAETAMASAGENERKRGETAALTASFLAEFKREISGEQAELRHSMEACGKVSEEAGEKVAALEKSFTENIARLDTALSEVRGRREEETNASASRLSGLERVLAEARERLEILERALKENSKYFRSLLSEEASKQEGTAAGLQARLTGLEQMLAEERGGAAVAAVEWQRSAAGLREEMSALKSEIVGTAETAFREARARLETVAARTKEEVLAATREELSSLEPQLKTAQAEVKEAQKTAFLAFEKCDKLDRNMAYIEQKSASLERRYYRYIEEDPVKPTNNV